MKVESIVGYRYACDLPLKSLTLKQRDRLWVVGVLASKEDLSYYCYCQKRSTKQLRKKNCKIVKLKISIERL